MIYIFLSCFSVLLVVLLPSPGKLHSSYAAWAKANSEVSLNTTQFAELCDRKAGLERVKTNGVRLTKGITVKASDDQAPPSYDQLLAKALLTGLEAHRRGQTMSANPYENGTEDWAYWILDWQREALRRAAAA